MSKHSSTTKKKARALQAETGMPYTTALAKVLSSCDCTGSSAGLNACVTCPAPWPDIPGATRIQRSVAAPDGASNDS